MTLWEIDIHPAAGQPDRTAEAIAAEAADLGLSEKLAIRSACGYLLEGELDAEQVARLAQQLLSDRVVQHTTAGPVGDSALISAPDHFNANGNGAAREKPLPSQVVHVLPKPGVMDPVAESALDAIADFRMPVRAVRTLTKYWIAGLPEDQLRTLAGKVLANDSIEQVVIGPLAIDQLQLGAPYAFELTRVAIRELDDESLLKLSKEGQLYLTLVEMQTIRDHFRELNRDPTDVELESVAQTWSEHCSHKTLAGRIAYQDENGARQFDNMLKETIFAATQTIRSRLGDDDWCVSVFEDNAGVVRFDEQDNVVFKVETHNHPSALEPYGGANTGIGGVIRDPLGTGLGAKPICNTDVFCFAHPDTPPETLPPGVLHPRRVMKGVVSGVRDYGNRMGIPTVNGAICFDDRYLGNPLVFCGNVGILPRDKSRGAANAGELIVALGGRTGRDGIHGATFSSAELTSESESLSGGAVQIGNAITEKMVLDVLIAARDRGLYSAVTDCGAGGFSSAVGEMGEKIGAEVWLDRAPLKYEGLSYTEIWISEAQERMVLSVPTANWDEFHSLCAAEGVEATVIGRFEPTGRLKLKYREHEVADISMAFLHDGRPPIVRDAVFQPSPPMPLAAAATKPARSTRAANVKSSNGAAAKSPAKCNETLLRILGCLNVASKEWVIRQYDHEVQGGSVIKPLVGVENDGPSDAAVVRPKLSSRRGLVISCGINPRYGDLDPYPMAASAIDEAIRNAVAVGADPNRIAILDNFCWGYTDRAETLGSLVRAALACHDYAVAFGTPFISGKDSLNNEFSFTDAGGQRQTIAIPPTLLISALGQVDDVQDCVTMDFKEAGHALYQIGTTKEEFGGSHYALVENLVGGNVPGVDAEPARQTFAALHRAIRRGLVCACHDLSEGGLAVAVAEMAFAGEVGATVMLQAGMLADNPQHKNLSLLFSESNSRFVCEVTQQDQAEFERIFKEAGVPCFGFGATRKEPRLEIAGLGIGGPILIDASLESLKQAWQQPLAW